MFTNVMLSELTVAWISGINIVSVTGKAEPALFGTRCE